MLPLNSPSMIAKIEFDAPGGDNSTTTKMKAVFHAKVLVPNPEISSSALDSNFISLRTKEKRKLHEFPKKQLTVEP